MQSTLAACRAERSAPTRPAGPERSDVIQNHLPRDAICGHVEADAQGERTHCHNKESGFLRRPRAAAEGQTIIVFNYSSGRRSLRINSFTSTCARKRYSSALTPYT